MAQEIVALKLKVALLEKSLKRKEEELNETKAENAKLRKVIDNKKDWKTFIDELCQEMDSFVATNFAQGSENFAFVNFSQAANSKAPRLWKLFLAIVNHKSRARGAACLFLGLARLRNQNVSPLVRAYSLALVAQSAPKAVSIYFLLFLFGFGF